jgi:hypothetical protein
MPVLRSQTSTRTTDRRALTGTTAGVRGRVREVVGADLIDDRDHALCIADGDCQ